MSLAANGEVYIVDDLDYDILALLQQDGRRRFTEIAETLGVTEGTVRNRVGKLREDGALQIVGLIEPQHLGLDAPALIGVTVDPPHLDEAVAAIGAFPEVSYLIMVSGEYDLIVEVMCRDREHLASFIKDELHRAPGIKQTQTFLILQTFKMAQGAQPRRPTG